MERYKEIDKFRCFLKKDNALLAFWEASIYWIERRVNDKSLVNIRQSKEFLNFSFRWDPTRNGYDYWHTKHNEWNSYLGNYV